MKSTIYHKLAKSYIVIVNLNSYIFNTSNWAFNLQNDHKEEYNVA